MEQVTLGMSVFGKPLSAAGWLGVAACCLWAGAHFIPRPARRWLGLLLSAAPLAAQIYMQNRGQYTHSPISCRPVGPFPPSEIGE